MAKPMLPRWAVLATAEEIAGIATVSSVAEDVLAAMTLRRFYGHAVVIQPDQRRVEPRLLWGGPGPATVPPAWQTAADAGR